jgi:hypothetical protein
MVAVSNAPVESESVSDGTRHVRFRETPPLPTYLVAWAVGQFDVYVGKKAGRRGIELRVYAPEGRAEMARALVDETPRVLSWIEDYLDVDFPFAKLDQVVVPRFHNGGYAMENAGLITYDEGMFRRTTFPLETVAHEIAHQWFGDLVTAHWWNDIWLNEGLASFMQERVDLALTPGARDHFARGRSWALANDDARLMRPLIREERDITAAFSPAVYSRAATLLSMIESWIGAIAFRRSLHAYLSERPWRSVDASDFAKSVERVTHRSIDHVLASYLDQPGVPVVAATLSCDRGPRIELRQPARWTIPICARWSAGAFAGDECALLDGERGEIKLHAPRCPDWFLLGNPGARAYHVHYSAPVLAQLLERDDLNGNDRYELAVGVAPLVRAGRLRASEAIPLVDRIARSGDKALAMWLAIVLGERFIDAASHDEWAAFLRRTFADWLNRSWPTIDFIRAIYLDDPAPLARLAPASQWLMHLGAIPDPEMTSLLAARSGDSSLVTYLLDDAPDDDDEWRVDLARRMVARVRAPSLRDKILERWVASTAAPEEERVAVLESMIRDSDGAAAVQAFLTARPEVVSEDARARLLAAATDEQTTRANEAIAVRATLHALNARGPVDCDPPGRGPRRPAR